MNIYKYYCLECNYCEILNYSKIYPYECPKCGSMIALQTDIEGVGGRYRVLIPKKADDLKVDDVYFHYSDNEGYLVKGIIPTTKKNKPILIICLEGFGSIKMSKENRVYCVNGSWSKK